MEVGKDLTTKVHQSCASIRHVLASKIKLHAALYYQTAPTNALKHMNSNAIIGLKADYVLPILVQTTRHPRQDLAVDLQMNNTNAMMMFCR